MLKIFMFCLVLFAGSTHAADTNEGNNYNDDKSCFCPTCPQHRKPNCTPGTTIKIGSSDPYQDGVNGKSGEAIIGK